MPRITILMPVYNGEEYLKETMDSVLAQTFSDFEFLIINDGSTDSSKEIILSYQDERIHLIENDCNLGLVATLNKGLDMIETEFIARMDADDLWDEHKLEKQIEVLDNHPEVGLCGTSIEKFGCLNGIMIFPKNNDTLKVGFLFYCMMSHPSVVFRRSMLKKSGLKYKRDAFPAEDYKLWVDCLDATQIFNIPEPLVKYRQHESQICRQKTEVQKIKDSEIKTELLRRIYPKISDEEISFHNEIFSSLAIHTDEELFMFQRWTQKLIEQNIQSKYVEPVVMKEELLHYLDNSIYSYLHNKYFSEKRHVFKYLMSGDWKHLSAKRRMKILIK